MGRIGIDVGGTFTDAVIVDDGGAHADRQGALDARRRSRRASSTRCARCWSAAARGAVERRLPGARLDGRHQRDRAAAPGAHRPGHQRGLPRRAGHRHADARARLRPVDAGARARGAARAVRRGRRTARRAGRRASTPLDEAERARARRPGCATSGVEAVAVMLLFSFAEPRARASASARSWPRSCPACRWRCPAAWCRSSASTCAPRRPPSTPRCCRCSARTSAPSATRSAREGVRGAAAPHAVQRRRGAGRARARAAGRARGVRARRPA